MRSPTAIQINHEGHFLYIYIRDKCTHYCVGGNISAGFRTNEALCLLSGADPGFQVRGGVLKKIASSGGRREKFWGISCEKSRFYAKKILFFPILGGGGRAGFAPPWIHPWLCYEAPYLGPKGGRSSRPTQAVRHTCSENIGIVKNFKL